VAPVLGLAQSGPQLVADRYSYLASMPLVLLAAGAFLSSRQSGAAVRWTAGSAAIAALLALGILTWRYSGKWRDSETLWTYALDRNPASYIAMQNLGQVRADQSETTADPAARRAKLAEARTLFEKGFALRPHPDFLVNIASIYLNLALLEPASEREHQLQAVACVDRARELYQARNLPVPETTLEFAEVLFKVGRVEDSIREMQAIARLHPDQLAARLNLGALLLELKRPQEAISHLEAAARLAPAEAAAWSPLARARDALSQRDRAVEAYRTLLRIKSDQLGPAANMDPECQRAQARLRAMGATP
jgi:tetratricopeptide (TPR) repeat protein